MSGQIWHLAITDGGRLADGYIGGYETTALAARTAADVLDLVAQRLRDWSAAADLGDPLIAHAVEITERLEYEAAQLRKSRTDEQFEEILEDPNIASIPLNTLALDHDERYARDPYTETPVPFSGRWSERPLWLQTWTTRTDPPDRTPPRPAMRAAPAARGIHPLARLRKAQP